MAAEDYIDPYFCDEYEPDDSDFWVPERELNNYMRRHGNYPWSGYFSKADEPKAARQSRRVKIDVPGTEKLSSLQTGETFRLPGAVKPSNVYMVIQSPELDDE